MGLTESNCPARAPLRHPRHSRKFLALYLRNESFTGLVVRPAWSPWSAWIGAPGARAPHAVTHGCGSYTDTDRSCYTPTLVYADALLYPLVSIFIMTLSQIGADSVNRYAYMHYGLGLGSWMGGGGSVG